MIMDFTLLSYNVLYNKAYLQLQYVIDKYHPDIICLQEVDTNEQNLSYLNTFGYRLADYSNSFLKFGNIYGIATFYNPNRARLIKSNSFFLPRSAYEFFLTILRILQGGNKSRTLLETHFVLNCTKTTITVFNTHLTMFGANGIRLKQIQETLNYYQITKKSSVILAGDFNYLPYGRKRLETLMKTYGFTESTRKINYTIKYSQNEMLKYFNFIQRFAAKIYSKFFTDRLKIDYIYHKGLTLRKVKRVDIQLSDHFPIIVYFRTPWKKK
ncbi:endonuclease/exonuclease/phosphatase family protein [Candidatus Roizmanbacteria bacterium]|nr:endonuclease/exonuclease/phosphatase family protein [Candidatus Roizmanbacteria bacterium]